MKVWGRQRGGGDEGVGGLEGWGDGGVGGVGVCCRCD